MKRDDAGTSVLELVLASGILLLALASFLFGLSTQQRVSTIAGNRQRALDELRLTANVFAKDARQASAITEATPSRITMRTYVGGSAGLSTVTYEVVTTPRGLDLVRREGEGRRNFVVKLSDATVFAADSPDVADVKTITLDLSTATEASKAPVSLMTEVSLRNVGS